MSTRAIPCSDCPSCRHRPQPTRAAFVRYHRQAHITMRCAPEIAAVRRATDPLRCITFWIAGLIVTAGQPATIQIPIALPSSLTTTQPAAVSSLEASPTPAH